MEPILKYFTHAINVLLVSTLMWTGSTLVDTRQGIQLINQEMKDRHDHYAARQAQIDNEFKEHEERMRVLEKDGVSTETELKQHENRLENLEKPRSH